MRAGLLIRGEPGSGRQFLARATHAAQSGSGGPFVVLDCASHAADALERLLFGSPAGTNGHYCVSAGSLLHQAAGGTLYLRHVTELPPRLQLRLARLLRDGEVLLAGNGHRVSLDVRPIAGVEAADSDRAADEGRVRDDLARVLSIIGIDMPPLRQRRRHARQSHAICCGTSARSSSALPYPCRGRRWRSSPRCPWHGNIIELRALLESIVNGTQTARTIELDDVVSRLHLNGSPPVPGERPEGGARAVRARVHSGRARRQPRPHQCRRGGAGPPTDQSLQEDPVAADFGARRFDPDVSCTFSMSSERGQT